MNGKIFCLPNNILKHRDSLCQLVLHVYINVYVLPRYTALAKTVYNIYKYIHIHKTLYLHWWFLILDCQGAFWLTS